MGLDFITPACMRQARKSQEVHCLQLKHGSWCCASWLLLVSLYISTFSQAMWRVEGKGACNKCSMHRRRTKRKRVASMRIDFFWICSQGNGRREWEFKELGMKDWRSELAELKEGPGETATGMNPPAFSLDGPPSSVLPENLLFASSLFTKSLQEDMEGKKIQGRIKSEPWHQDQALPLKLTSYVNVPLAPSALVSTTHIITKCVINYFNAQTRK